MRKALLHVKVGDTSTWTLTLLEGTGGKDLTNATAIALYLRRQGDSALTIDGGSCTKDPDQTTYPGKLTFTPSAAQVAEQGIYQMEIKVTWSGGSVGKWPSLDYDRVEISDSMSG